jgi:opacity protein-like surface antigen
LTTRFRILIGCVLSVAIAPSSLAMAQGNPEPATLGATEAPASAPTTALPSSAATVLPAAESPPAAPAEAPASEPFAFADFTWLNGNNRQKTALLDTKYFTPSLLIDVNYTASRNNPIDNTVVGSTALSRNNEFTLAFLGFGGDFHAEGGRARLMTQYGVRSTLVPRNDTSTNRGQFDLQTALRYVSEAWGGYHWDVLHGINLDAGIFMSYVGLFSYDNFENWMYLPSFTSDNTPWFFNGLRAQIFPTDRFKVELWLINGWQTYGKFNSMPGFGTQILWRPTEALSFITNDYVGFDTQDAPGRIRFHSDNSFQMRWLNLTQPVARITRAAFSITADIGWESGDGVVGFGGSGTEGHCSKATPCTQHFLSAMAYHRLWFGEKFAVNVGGGFMSNPGRYLVLSPTGNASSSSLIQPLGVSPPTTAFDYNNGTKFNAFDYSAGIQYMPSQLITIDIEYNHRQADVPYFAGHGGVTSPDGYVNTAIPSGWRPDLSKTDDRIIIAMLTRF